MVGDKGFGLIIFHVESLAYLFPVSLNTLIAYLVFRISSAVFVTLRNHFYNLI